MRTVPLPSQERLRELLDYDGDKGVLFWRERPGEWRFNAQKAGQPACMNVTDSGYLGGTLDKQNYRTHRLVYKWCHNEEPDEIDHINGNKQDNRIANLRAVTRQQNMRNNRHVDRIAANRAGLPSCITPQRGGRYQARVNYLSRSIALGSFATIAEAHAAVGAADRMFLALSNQG